MPYGGDREAGPQKASHGTRRRARCGQALQSGAASTLWVKHGRGLVTCITPTKGLKESVCWYLRYPKGQSTGANKFISFSSPRMARSAVTVLNRSEIACDCDITLHRLVAASCGSTQPSAVGKLAGQTLTTCEQPAHKPAHVSDWGTATRGMLSCHLPDLLLSAACIYITKSAPPKASATQAWQTVIRPAQGTSCRAGGCKRL